MHDNLYHMQLAIRIMHEISYSVYVYFSVLSTPD